MNAYDRGQQIRLPGRFGINVTSLRSEAAAGALTIKCRKITGFAAPDALMLDPGLPTEEVVTVQSVSGLDVVVTTATVYMHGVGARVMELSDPAAITLKIQTPDGVDTNYTYALAQITKDSVGQYSKLVSLTQTGEWLYAWAGTVSPEAGVEHKFVVNPTQF